MIKRKILLGIFCILLASLSFAQETREESTNTYLASLFKIFYSVDTEIAICMSPILEKRLVKIVLEDSAKFSYSFKNLSEYITVRTAKDSLVKTFSWDRIRGGTFYYNVSYVQFKTKYGKVKYQRLDAGDEYYTGEPTDVIVYDIFPITSKDTTNYLVLGWGTHGAGMHHSLARVYKIEDDKFTLCTSCIDGNPYLLVEVPRIAKINMTYDSKTKELSHNTAQNKVIWKYTESQFKTNQ